MQNPSKSNQHNSFLPKAWCCYSSPQSNEEYEGYLRTKGFHRRCFMKKILSFIALYIHLTQAASHSSTIKYGITKDNIPRVKLKELHPTGEPHLKFRHLIKNDSKTNKVDKMKIESNNVVAF